MLKWKVIQGHVLDVLPRIPDGMVRQVVTSPPFFGLRNYPIPPTVWGGDPACDHSWGEFTYKGIDGGKNSPKQQIKGSANFQTVGDIREAFCLHCGAWLGQLGQEPSLTMYVDHMVGIGRELHRILADDGTFWLEQGDTYSGSGRGMMADGTHSREYGTRQGTNKGTLVSGIRKSPVPEGCKPQDLMLVPATVAAALRADGWHLRMEIVWYRPNGFVSSTRNRVQKKTSRIYVFAKRSTGYYWDEAEAREPAVSKGYETRITHDVWIVNNRGSAAKHFAAWPYEVPEKCIKIGSEPGDLVLDPFGGTGITGQAALGLGRNYLGIDLGEDVYESKKLLEKARGAA